MCVSRKANFTHDSPTARPSRPHHLSLLHRVRLRRNGNIDFVANRIRSAASVLIIHSQADLPANKKLSGKWSHLLLLLPHYSRTEFHAHSTQEIFICVYFAPTLCVLFSDRNDNRDASNPTSDERNRSDDDDNSTLRPKVARRHRERERRHHRVRIPADHNDTTTTAVAAAANNDER